MNLWQTIASAIFPQQSIDHKQKHTAQTYQNGQFGTPYPTKLLLLLFLRPHLCASSSSSEDLLQDFEFQIMNQDEVQRYYFLRSVKSAWL